MVKVSVIVPVYNGEKHLRECLDSICGQTLKEIEILCVDDGSTDSSYEILKEYQEKDARIRVFRQKNLYAGVARNLGKSHAAGEYLAFWDCDDFFDIHALELLYDRARNVDADVCVCGGNQYLESKGTLYPCPPYLYMNRVPETDTFNRFTNPEHYLDFTNSAAWNKLFRREYIEHLGLDFQPIRNGNDVYFTVNALGLADRIAVLNKKLVNYRVNQTDGLVQTLSRSPLSPIQAWVDIAENLSKYEGFGERSFANKALVSMTYMLQNISEWEAFCQAINMLKEGALRAMYIVPQAEGYYYGTGKKEFVDHIYEDTPEEFAVFLANRSYRTKTEQVAEKRKLNQKYSRLKKRIVTLRREWEKEREEEAEKYKTFSDQYAQMSEEFRLLAENKDQVSEEYEVLLKKYATLEKELSRVDRELRETRTSWSYRAGRIIAWLPDRIRRFWGKRRD